MIEQDNAPSFVQQTLDLDPALPSPVVVERHHQPSPAYLDLEAERDATVARRRSGAKAIATRAFRALQAGLLTKEEYANLFPARDDVPSDYRNVPFEELSMERPPRPLDHAELAAGEGVHRVDDIDD